MTEGERLSVQGVTVSLAGSVVLDGVHLEVPAGKLTGIVGPNGSGKSTLLRAVARLLTPDGGSVVIGADETGKLRRRQLARRLALVEQSASTDLDLTALDVALLGRIPHQDAWQSPHDLDRTIALRHLAQVGMADKAHRSWHTLSGGEQQRVQLARAFAQEPAVLALDEPTNHLDIAHALRLMATVQHSPLTVVAALHDLNLAAMFCDWLVVLHQGRVVASGTPDEVLTPGLLHDVYGVRASVEPDRVTGRTVITFHPPAQTAAEAPGARGTAGATR